MGKKTPWWERKKQPIHSEPQIWIREKNAWRETGSWIRKFNVGGQNQRNVKVLQWNHAQHEVRLRNRGPENDQPIHTRKNLTDQKECPSHTRNAIDQIEHAVTDLGNETIIWEKYPIHQSRTLKLNQTTINSAPVRKDLPRIKIRYPKKNQQVSWTRKSHP